MPIIELDDGREIEFPEGMSAAAMSAALRKLPSLTRGSSPSLGDITRGVQPDPFASVNEAVRTFMKDPAEGQNFLQRLITGGGMAAGMALPGLLGPIMAGSRLAGPLAVRPALNAIGQGAISAGESALKGGSPLTGGLIGGGLQGVMEAAATPLRIKGMVKTGRAAQGAYREAEAAREAGVGAENAAKQGAYESRVAGDQSRYESLKSVNDADRAAYEQAQKAAKQTYEEVKADLLKSHKEGTVSDKTKVAAVEASTRAANTAQQEAFGQVSWEVAEQRAGELVKKLKDVNPALADIPETTEGLYKIVKGDGLRRTAGSFDDSIAAMVDDARYMKPLTISLEDAQKLKMKTLGKQVFSEEVGQTVEVSAQELLQKTIGVWKKDKGLYSRMTDVLADNGLVDSEARNAYKSTIGHIEFIDKAHLLEGGRFHPEKILPAMEKDNKTLDLLRRRMPEEDFYGPTANLGRGLPEAPADLPMPGPLNPRAELEIPKWEATPYSGGSPLEPMVPQRPTPAPFEAGPLSSPDVTMLNRPHIPHYTLPLALGTLGGLAGPGGHTAGALMGAGLGVGADVGLGMLPRQIPMGNLADDAMSIGGMDIPTLIQTILREQMGY